MMQWGRTAIVLLAISLAAGCTTLTPAPVRTVAAPTFDAGSVRTAPWALVLSGGSLRGFAHVGVLKALAAEGLQPDLIVGVSAGAIVGSIAASGATPAEMEAAATAIRPRIFTDFGSPHTGLLGGGKIHAFVDAHAKAHRFEDYPVRFAVVAVEAQRACLQVFNRGDVGLAVQASATVPVVLAPPEIESRQYLDGSLISPVPVRVARALGALRVVAVDVTFDPSERRFHSIFDAFWRTNLVMNRTLATLEAVEADLVIEPQLPPEREITLSNRMALIAAGEEATRTQLPRIRGLLKQTPGAPTAISRWTLAKLLCPEVATALNPTAGR